MTRPHAPMLLWTAAFAALGVVAVVVFDPPDPETPALFGGGALLMALLAAYVLTRAQGPPDAGDRSARVVPDSSWATAWLAVSVAALALGAELGLWLVLVGAGMAVVGVAGIVRERRASRALADHSLKPGSEGWGRASAGATETSGGEGVGPRLRLPGED